MCGRFEGKKRYGIAVFTAVSFFMSFGMAMGQDLPDKIIQLIEAESEMGTDGLESLVEYYESLIRRPMNINSASEESLRRLGLLSDFQIISLIEYRQEYGDLQSLAELSLVDGFDEALAWDLSPFIMFLPQEEYLPLSRDRIRNDLIIRSRTSRKREEEESQGIPYYFYGRYKFRYGEWLQMGATMENDAGETKIPDFLSGYVSVKSIPIAQRVGLSLKSAVVGDFSARLGQGLSLWNSFSMSGLSSPSSIFKQESGVVPYTSSDEQNFFRGAGATFTYMERVSGSILFSKNRLDAKCDEYGYYSLPTGGYHNTDSAMEKRRKLSETVLGGNISYKSDWFKVGISAVAYSYDKHNYREYREYNRFQMYDGWWGNNSADFHIVMKGLRCFGEVAIDWGGSFAALAGAISTLAPSLEASALYRYYSKSYIAPHSGAYSSTSSCSNENGLLLNTKWTLSRKIVINAASDFAMHPWQRFGIPQSSKVSKNTIQCDFVLNAKNSFNMRLSYNWNDYDMFDKFRIRASYLYKSTSGFGAATRCEVSLSSGAGALLYQEVLYKAPSKRIECVLRGWTFHIDSWDNRIYVYERDLPHTFSVPVMYGRGVGAYFFVKYMPLSWIDVVFKISGTKYEKVEKDVLNIKMQLNLSF